MYLSNDNIIHVKKDNVEYLQFKKLLEYEDVITHAYSLGIDWDFRTARNGIISEELLKKGLNCYKEFCKYLNIDYRNIVKPRQSHSDNAQIVKQKINKNEPDFNLNEYLYTDGLITNKPNLILSTTNADCILLLFFDPRKRVIANVHSGWRGTLQGICVKTVAKMQNSFGCNPGDIICCMSPSIRKCHFEVDEDVMLMFKEQYGKWINYNIIQKQNGRKKWNIDTILLNKLILRESGLKEDNIIDSGLCSVCNSDLIHSYRIEKQGYGLGTALISLK